MSKKLFLSAVSSEFEAYRRLLAGDLKRPDLDVAVQEDFINTGGSTLEKLDDYVRQCDAVIHLIGKATGSLPEEPAVKALLSRYPDFADRLPSLKDPLTRPQPGFSYTQWEAYLGIYHRRPVFVYRPTDFELNERKVPRDTRFAHDPAQEAAQKEHYQRICELGKDRGQFANEERLSSAVLRDLVDILPTLEPSIDVSATKLRHSAKDLIGRDDELSRLDAAWNDFHKNVVVVRAWGGVGKTSLVATWMAELALKNWRAAQRVFDWSFYSQGTRDQGAASADLFFSEALAFFGDKDPKVGSPWERGARLAKLVGQTRSLLVLDGLEPLQHPPGALHGKLKDPGIEAFLKGLCAQNRGLCVVTTREQVPDIQQHYGRTAIDWELTHLSPLAGATVLHAAGATRAGAKEIEPDDKELQQASRDVRGHALTLQLMGKYLALVEEGDIRKRDTLRLEEADHEYQNDATRPYGHAFKAMEAYEAWLSGKAVVAPTKHRGRPRKATDGEDRELQLRQLAILRLLGLFDRAASKPCLNALRAEPAIPGLTAPLVGLNEKDWKLAIARLRECGLLSDSDPQPSTFDPQPLDTHPLIREYFAHQLRTHHPEAYRAAHRRLYEHLCETTQEGDEPTLAELEPLYQAVWHGCQAGLQQEACEQVYRDRINKGTGSDGFYATKKLGALGADLGAIAWFFDVRWSQVSPALSAADQAWLLSQAAFRLRALGRLREAVEPMRAGLDARVEEENWKQAAISASNLSELSLTLGEVADGVEFGRQSVDYADRSGDAHERLLTCTAHADALHQSGQPAAARALFEEAERLQRKRQPEYPLLYSLRGFQYCDLLLAPAEQAAAQHPVCSEAAGPLSRSALSLEQTSLLNDVEQRATQSIKIAERNHWLLDIALDHLTLARVALYRGLLTGSPIPSPADSASPIAQAVAGLRHAGQQQYMPLGLLTSAWTRHATGDAAGAMADLDEAWEIAERGPMPLFMAEVLLYRARLWGKEERGRTQEKNRGYPRGSAAADLQEARRLIEKHGYGRRLPELQDAEQALLPS
ncbi:MAG: DUF4062 domain-containing protein [Planctomycetaceae bacterium]|nr:DUF4062 domain-containing protein [Planctomycetaceae bacterium]